MSQEAIFREKKSIYIVWIIPFVAIFIAIWMIYKHYDNLGYDITITFNNGNGMSIGKTPLMYNGIKIGQVSSMKIHEGDISKVDVVVSVDKSAQGVAKEGNVFWKVEPTLSLTEITGLSTILSGVYIEVMPSVKDPIALNLLKNKIKFIAEEEVPRNIFEPGLNVTLHAKEYNVKVGAPIMYKKINIGKIVDAKLSDDGVDYIVHVDDKYTKFIKKNSKFWKISSVEVRASLSGLRIEMDSLASLITGGISISSPKNGEILKISNAKYKLYEDKNDLDLVDDYISLVSKSGYNIDTKSAHVYFKGSDAGNIVLLDYNPIKDKTTFKIKLKSKFRHLANKDAHFWIVEPKIGINEIKGLDAISRGTYITFETSSRSKKLKSNFTLYDDAPKIKGKHFKLIANQSYDLKNGVNVIYKDIIIGSVRDMKLSKEKNNVNFEIVISKKYQNLVNDSSGFYIQSAIELDASLDGIYLNIGSSSSMLNGGIILQSLDLKAKHTKTAFKLMKDHKAFEEAKYLEDGGKTFILNSNKLGSLKNGSNIIYKGIKAGKVLSYKLNKKTKKVDIKIYIQKKYIDQVNNSTNFYNISGLEIKANLHGIEINTGSLESIINGGISFKTPFKDDEVENLHEFKLYNDEDEVNEKFIEINFLLDADTQLKEGALIVYKSINIGEVKKLILVDDKLNIKAFIKEKYKNLLLQDTKFWIEDISINIDNIKNPSAIISGAFIKVLKGNSNIKANEFILSTKSPAPSINKKGLRIFVTGSRLSSLKIGSPVFYRQIKIGSIEAYSLSEDSKGVKIKLFIDKCYSYLVRKNSLFYNATVMGMDISFFSIKLSTETLATMIHGGITMVTPDEPLELAKNSEEFKLYDEVEDDWLEYAPKLINNLTSCKKIF